MQWAASGAGVFKTDSQKSVDRSSTGPSTVMHPYNNVRLHSPMSFLRPVAYYRCNPWALPAERFIENTLAVRSYRTGSRNKVRSVDVSTPPITTVARGR